MPVKRRLVAGGPIPHRPRAAQGRQGAPPSLSATAAKVQESSQRRPIARLGNRGCQGRAIAMLKAEAHRRGAVRSSIALAIATAMTIWTAPPASTADAAWPNQVQARYRLQFNGIEVGIVRLHVALQRQLLFRDRKDTNIGALRRFQMERQFCRQRLHRRRRTASGKLSNDVQVEIENDVGKDGFRWNGCFICRVGAE